MQMNPITAFKQTISGLLASPDSVDAKKHAAYTMKNHQFVTQTSRKELAIKLTITVILGMLTFGVVSIILIAKDIRDMVKADDDIKKSARMVNGIISELKKAVVQNNSITLKLGTIEYKLEDYHGILTLKQGAKIIHEFNGFKFEQLKDKLELKDELSAIDSDNSSSGSLNLNDTVTNKRTSVQIGSQINLRNSSDGNVNPVNVGLTPHTNGDSTTNFCIANDDDESSSESTIIPVTMEEIVDVNVNFTPPQSTTLNSNELSTGLYPEITNEEINTASAFFFITPRGYK